MTVRDSSLFKGAPAGEKAATIDPFANRPHMIVPVSAAYSLWLGGATYLKNLLGLLGMAVQAGRRAPTVSLFANDTQTELFQTLSRRPAISFVIGRNNRVSGFSPTFLEAVGCMAAPGGDAAAAARLTAVVGGMVARAVTFPLTYDEFPAAMPRPLYWIPDFQHKILPDFFPQQVLSARDRVFGAIAAHDGCLMLSSRDALGHFQAHYPDARVRTHVWPFVSMLAADADTNPAAVRGKYGLPQRFFYIANQFWAHKDHRTAFRALKIVRDQGLPVELVCSGALSDFRDDGFVNALLADLRESGLMSHVRIVGVVPKAEQLALFRCATAVVQPSRFEGWSTVVEDARALGRPLLLSDIPVHGEQLPEAPYRFRTGDADDLARVMAMAWRDLPDGPDPLAEREAAAGMKPRRLAAADRFTAILDRIVGVGAEPAA